ncbi:MAG: phosphatase [Gammaproteobacteria bacterium]|nr:phosphatase [Gammaproteobacteria bacterium]
MVKADSIKFGLGSCLDQDLPQPIWQPIKKEKLNYFIFLGDNVYGDVPSGSLRKMKKAYQKQKLIFPDFLNEINIFSIWDDHDYGLNDGGSKYRNKTRAQKLFLEFWEIPKEDIRHKQKGIYFSEEKIFFNKKFKLIFLDTRYFRSELKGRKGNYTKNKEPNATILGAKQWEWFEGQLNEDFDFLMIFSSIQIIPQDHGFEKWDNFPKERDKILNMIEKYKGRTLLFSGDRHRSGIYKKDGIIEATASSMNKPGSSFSETDTFLIGETYPQANFSILEIFQNSINIKIKDESGMILNSLTLNY